MSLTYASTGITQQDDTASGNTTSAASTTTSNSTTLTFTGLGFTTTNNGNISVVGKVITAPAALAGALVTATVPANASASGGTAVSGVTSITVNKVASVASGTTVTFADTDHLFSGNTGVTLSDSGTYPNRVRQITLTGTSTQFTINGTFYNDARWNSYVITSSGAQSSQTGILVKGTFNSLNTQDNTTTGAALTTGSVAFKASNQAAKQDSVGSPIVFAGTVNFSGVGYYANNYLNLDTANQGTGGTGCVVTWNNSIIRTGVATDGSLVSVYGDAFRGTSLTSRFTCNINNSSIVDTYLKFLSVKTSSQFNNVRWYKTIPQTNTLSTNLDAAIAIAPSASVDTYGFNFSGPTFGITNNAGSYYNTHIAVGNTSSNNNAPTAVRSTVYGYESGVAPRIGKVPDFPSVRPWVEGRKNLALTVNKSNGTAVAANAVSSYLEDSNLNTGQLATAAIGAFNNGNAGFNNGIFTSASAVIPGGGTNGQITITISGGKVVDATISNAGSGYSTTSGTPLSVTVNNTSFPGAGAGTAAAVIYCYPYQRYGAYATGNTPDFTANRTYTAQSNASGVMNVSTNPLKGDGSAAYTGMDFLIWTANASYPDLANTWASAQTLVPIDQRWSANGSTAYSINIPLRGYLYNDYTYVFNEANGGGATPQQTNTIIMPDDAFVQATGITETTAATYTDITLVTPAPTRDGTTGALIPSTTGTLSISAGSTGRTLDQIYAKAKYDYVRPLLDSTAGTIAHTGFGIGPFLNATGSNTNATMGVGGWNVSANIANIAQGSTFRGLTTTGNINLTSPPTSVSGSWASFTGNNITVGNGGTPATWNTNFNFSTVPTDAVTPIAVSGLGLLCPNFSASMQPPLSVLVSPTWYSSIQNSIQTSLTNAIRAATGSTAATATVSAPTGTVGFGGSITFTTGGGITGSFPTTYTTFADSSYLGYPNTQRSRSYIANGTTITSSDQAINTFVTTLLQLLGDVFNSTVTWNTTPPTTWSNSTTYTLNFTIAYTPSSTRLQTVDSINFTQTASQGSATQYTTLSGAVNGATAVNMTGLTWPVSFSLPSVSTAVLPAPAFSTTQARTTLTTTNSNITANVPAATLGFTSSLIATTRITGIPTSGSVAQGPSATAPITINFGTSSTVTMSGNMTFTNATLRGTLTVTPDMAGRRIAFVNCDTTNLTLVNATPATTIGLTGWTNAVPTGFTLYFIVTFNADQIGGTYTVFNGIANPVASGTITAVNQEVSVTALTAIVWSQPGYQVITQQAVNRDVTFNINHVLLPGGVPTSTQIFTQSYASGVWTLTTNVGTGNSPATAGTITRDGIVNLFGTATFHNFVSYVTSSSGANKNFIDTLSINNTNSIVIGDTSIQFRSSPVSSQFYVGGITANAGFANLTQNIQIAGSTVSTTTTSAISAGAITSVPVSVGSAFVVGTTLTAPATLAGAVVTASTATTISFASRTVTAIASGTTVSGTTPAASILNVPQIVNISNSQVDVGAIVPAVQQGAGPMFAKLDAGVKKASLNIPYSGSTYP